MIKGDQAIHIPEPKFSHLLFSHTRFSWVWLLLRLYIGYEWFMAGWEKVFNPKWVGAEAGTALTGFLRNISWGLAGSGSAVSPWYNYLIQNFGLPHTVLISYLVVYGELIVGILLFLGAFTGIAAFLGIFMNFNYLFAGVVSVNPLFVIIEIFLILAWRNAGWWGLDRYLLPKFGVPWKRGYTA